MDYAFMKSVLLFFIILIIAASPQSIAQKRKGQNVLMSFFNAGEYFLAIDPSKMHIPNGKIKH